MSIPTLADHLAGKAVAAGPKPAGRVHLLADDPPVNKRRPNGSPEPHIRPFLQPTEGGGLTTGDNNMPRGIPKSGTRKPRTPSGPTAAAPGAAENPHETATPAEARRKPRARQGEISAAAFAVFLDGSVLCELRGETVRIPKPDVDRLVDIVITLRSGRAT